MWFIKEFVKCRRERRASAPQSIGWTKACVIMGSSCQGLGRAWLGGSSPQAGRSQTAQSLGHHDKSVVVLFEGNEELLVALSKGGTCNLILERDFRLQKGLVQRKWHQKDDSEDLQWSPIEELRTQIYFPNAMNQSFSPFSPTFPHSLRYIYLFCPRSLDEWSTGEKPTHLPARYLTIKSSVQGFPSKVFGQQVF